MKKKNNSMPSIPMFLSSASGNVSTAELAAVGEEIKKSCQPRKHYSTNISENTELEVGSYANVYGTKATLDKFQMKYPRDTFLWSSIKNRKWKIATGEELQNKKDISNTFLLDLGLFALYENEYTIIFVTQKESYDLKVQCMNKFLTDWNIMSFWIIFITVCGEFRIFLYVCYIFLLSILSRSTKSVEQGITI